MKIIQTELPITLQLEKGLDKWTIPSEGNKRPRITSELSMWDKLLCIPYIKGPLIKRTELVSPFYGETYAELFEDDTRIKMFSLDGSVAYSGQFIQENDIITKKINGKQLLNSISYGIITGAAISPTDIGIYTTLGGIVGILSIVINYGETEKRIFEKIVTNLEANEDTTGKINVDYILNEINGMTNDSEILKNSILPDIENIYGPGLVQFLEPSIHMKSASGKITCDGVSADMTAETPFFIKKGDFPLYIKAISDINIASEGDDVVLNGSIKSIDAQELYILVKNEGKTSRLVDIIDKYSTILPDEFASGQYTEMLKFCGYVVDGKMSGKSSAPLKQLCIKDSGLLLKAEIGSCYNLYQINHDLAGRIIKETKKKIADLENIGLRAEPVYSDGKTIYNMSET